MPNYIDFHDHVKSVITKACYKAGFNKECAENFQYHVYENIETHEIKIFIWHMTDTKYEKSFVINNDSDNISDIDKGLSDAVYDIIDNHRILFDSLYNNRKENNNMNDNCTCTMPKEPPRPYRDNDYKPICVIEFKNEEERIRREYEEILADAKIKRDRALFENFKRFEQARDKEMAEERAFKMRTRYDEFIKAGFDDKTAKELMKEIY